MNKPNDPPLTRIPPSVGKRAAYSCKLVVAQQWLGDKPNFVGPGSNLPLIELTQQKEGVWQTN